MKAFVATIFFSCLFTLATPAQVNKIEVVTTVGDSTITLKINRLFDELVSSNFLLNTKGLPVALNIAQKQMPQTDGLFYVLLFFLLLLGIFRSFFYKYFNTLFRVFFNTSLRQNQLTDQLQQAKLPSLIFNTFFIISGGMYLYFVSQYFSNETKRQNWVLIIICIAAVGICYAAKFISVKFTGWVTNYKAEANAYIFIVFLINKVIGILLVPIIIILAFSTKNTAAFTVIFSFIALSVMVIVRFLRTFSMWQSKLKVSRFHFFMYVIGLEILPLMLIYKFVMVYLPKIHNFAPY